MDEIESDTETVVNFDLSEQDSDGDSIGSASTFFTKSKVRPLGATLPIMGPVPHPKKKFF